MPALFDQYGICFDFPDNWQVEADSESGADLSVTVTSPETAFWSLSRHSGETTASHLVENALEAMREEYPSLECEEAEDEIEEQFMAGYNLSFFYVDLCSTAAIRGFCHEGIAYLLIYQAEDRELARVEPVFRAITTSLLRHVVAAHS